MPQMTPAQQQQLIAAGEAHKAQIAAMQRDLQQQIHAITAERVDDGAEDDCGRRRRAGRIQCGRFRQPLRRDPPIQ